MGCLAKQCWLLMPYLIRRIHPVSQTVYCRCWRSEKFPLCDGAHVNHNAACGDNVGPLVIENDKAQ